MKKTMLAIAVLSLATISWASDSKQSDTERLDKAGAVLKEVMGAPDKGIPQEVLDHAKCIAVVPHMVKGGFKFCFATMRKCCGFGVRSNSPLHTLERSK